MSIDLPVWLDAQVATGVHVLKVNPGALSQELAMVVTLEYECNNNLSCNNNRATSSRDTDLIVRLYKTIERKDGAAPSLTEALLDRLYHATLLHLLGRTKACYQEQEARRVTRVTRKRTTPSKCYD